MTKTFSLSPLACCLLLLSSVSARAQFNTPSVNGTIGTGEYGNDTLGFNRYNDGARNWYLTWNNTDLFIATDGNGNPSNDELVIYIDTDPQTPANGGSNANGALGGIGGFDGNNYGRLPFRANFAAFIRNFYNQHRTHNGTGGWNTNVDNSPSISDFSSGTVQEVRIAWSIITGSGRPAAFRVFIYLNGTDPYGGLSRFSLDDDFSNKLDLTARMYFDIANTNDNESTPPFSRLCYINQRTSDIITDYGTNFFDVTTADNQTSTIRANMTIRNSLRTEGSCETTVSGDRTITMTGASGSIVNNGSMDANPSFGNTMNFTIDSVITLSGSNPVDVFNLTVNAGDTLKVTGTNLRSGNTGTITVNGVIEFGETNFAGSWGGTANFALNSGATLITANERGVNGDNPSPSSFNGSIRVNGTATYNANASYVFSRDGDQAVGFASQDTLPAIAQANRIATLTRPTTRIIALDNDFVVTASVSQPALNIGSNTTLFIAGSTLIAQGNMLGSGAIRGEGVVEVSSTPSAIQIGGLTIDNLSMQDTDGATVINDATVSNLSLDANVKLTLQSGVTLTVTALTVIDPETDYIITQTNAKLRRNVIASDSKLFPVGTSARAFPLTINTGGDIIGGDVDVAVDGSNPATGRMGDGTFAVQTIYRVQAPGFDFNGDVISLNFEWLASGEGTNFDRTKSFPARWTGSMWESYRTNSLLTRNNVPNLKSVSIGGLSVLAGEWAVFSGDDDSPLPVSLLDLVATPTTQGIRLSWRTATEQDNLGFIILRNGEERASYLSSPNLRGNGTTLAESRYEFLDAAVEAGRVYAYRLRSVDLNGTIHDYDLTATATAVEKILSYRLFQNYPNPFNPSTVIRYDLPEASQVKLEIFDMLGRKVATLVDARQSAGSYAVALDAARVSLASGAYLYRLSAGTYLDAKKMMFVK